MKAQTITTFPHQEDFESGANDWTTGGTNSSWELGTPAGETIDFARSGVNVWATNLDGYQNENEAAWLESPTIDLLDMVDDPYLIFALAGNTSYGATGLFVEYSLDNGVTFDTLGTSNDSDWYPNDDGFNSSTFGEYFLFSHRLEGAAGNQVKIRFSASTFLSTTEGFYLDDIQIVPLADIYLGVRNINSLPIYESFSRTFPYSYNTDSTTWALNGLDGFSLITSTGEGDIYGGVDGEGNESVAIYNGNDSSNLVFTVDLSDYAAATDDLRLEFTAENAGGLYSGEDSVYIRGSHLDDWIRIFDLSSLAYTIRENKAIDTLSQILLSNGQDYSETTQIRFCISSIYGSVRLYEMIVQVSPDYDVAILDVGVPEPSTFLHQEEVQIGITNRGLIEVTNIPIRLSVINPDFTVDQYDDAFNELLIPGDTQWVSMNVLFEETGNYLISAENLMVPDENSFNNISGTFRSGKLSVFEDAQPPFEFFADFEQGYFYERNTLVDVGGENGTAFIKKQYDNQSTISGNLREEFDGYSVSVFGGLDSAIFLMTLDVGSVDVEENDLILELDIAHFNSGPPNEVMGIFAREDPFLPWIEIFDYDVELEWGETPAHVIVNSIKDSMSLHGQVPGSEFQLALITSGYHSMLFDNIHVYESFPQPELAFSNSAPIVSESIPILRYREGFESDITSLSSVFSDPDDDPLTFKVFESFTNPLQLEHGSPAKLSVMGDSLIIEEIKPHTGLFNHKICAYDAVDSVCFGVNVGVDFMIQNKGPHPDITLVEGFGKAYHDLSKYYFKEDDGQYDIGYTIQVQDTSVLEMKRSIDLNDIPNFSIIEKNIGTTEISLIVWDKHDSIYDDFMISIVENQPPYVVRELPDIELQPGYGSYELIIEKAIRDPEGGELVLSAVSDNQDVLKVSEFFAIDTLNWNLQWVEEGIGVAEIMISVSDGFDTVMTSFQVSSQLLDLNFIGDEVIYPNPVVDHLNIRFEKEYGNLTFRIFDLQGKHLIYDIEQITPSLTRLHFDSLKPGIYVLEVNTEDETVFRRTFIGAPK